MATPGVDEHLDRLSLPARPAPRRDAATNPMPERRASLTTLNATIINLRRRSIFIGSSSEAVQRGIVAQMVDKLSDILEVRPWQQHFTGGRFTLEILISEALQADAAILIFTKDDPREFRGELNVVARDNVILE